MRWFKDMKIQNKLFLAFGILVLLMIFSSVFSLWNYNATDAVYSKLISGTAERQAYLSQAIGEAIKFRLYNLSAMDSLFDHGLQQEVLSHVSGEQKEAINAFAKILSDYRDSVLAAPDLPEWRKKEILDIRQEVDDIFRASYSKYLTDIDTAIKNNDEEMFRRTLLQGTLDANIISEKLEKLRGEGLDTIEKRNDEVTIYSLKTIHQVSIMAACIIIFSIFLSIFIARSVTNAISGLQTSMAEISKGNLLYPIRSENKDELGKLSNDIGDMIDQISELNKTVAFIDYLDCMIHIASFDFKIIYINQKMAETYGIDRENSINQKCYKVLHGYDEPCPHCLWPRVMSTKEQNKPFDRERYWDEKLGKWIGGKAAVIRWIDGSLVQFYYLTDETMDQEYETKLQEAAEAAEAASVSKSAFLANMSHEIRTPMNAILGITEIQMENEALPQETQEALGKIYSSGDLLLGIINDILDLSKIEAGKLELVPVKYSVASLINDTIHLNMMRFESKPIEFKLQIDENIPSELLGDELRIKQILNNLLSNAAKYTKSGEVVFSVSAESKNESNNVTLVFAVKDTGQGMTAEQLNTLFEDYTRFNLEANRTTEGTGLGMSITWRLIHMMNGEISVQSEPGKGSEFIVRLPQGKTDADPLGKDVAENLRQFRSNSISQMKKAQMTREPMPYGSVLVVDDMEANLYVAKGLLSPYGLRIETVGSGFQAVDKIKAGNEYDIVFMDHMMPGMDGIEAVKIIRETGYTRSIVALTANAVVGQADIFLANGFDDFISKPIDTRQLNVLLNKLIRDKQAPETIEAARQQQKTQQKDTPGESEDPGWSEDQLLLELSHIEGLNLDAGLEHIGQDKNGYCMILRHFVEHCDTYLAELATALQAEVWKDYAIKAHALKGVLANFGAETLSQWAAKLEKAAKDGESFTPTGDLSPAICREETQPFTTAVQEFRDKLRQTSLFATPAGAGKDDKPQGSVQFLKEQLELLKQACKGGSFGGVKKTIAALGEYQWDSDTETGLEKIQQFTVSFDYDEALKEIEQILRHN